MTLFSEREAGSGRHGEPCVVDTLHGLTKVV